MLVLTRKSAETIVIGEDIVIKVIKTGHGSVRIGIEAPTHISVMRGELLEREEPTVACPRPSLLTSAPLSDQYPHVA
ncbi:MAG: carbon storage regulator [Planctomycetaceae bacterium]|nr:carbon storage regulator [Planctomycetaceae bacterium]MCA9060649.1 carbon storage regulator [Planctomycetaceae bacterium]